MSKKIKRKSPQVRESAELDIPPPSDEEIAEIKRRIADMGDPTRYVIVSPFSRRFCLYYLPESGNYIMNEIPAEALFKRKAEAEAVAEVLEHERENRRSSWKRPPAGGEVKRRRTKLRRRSLQVIAVKKTNRGVRVLDEVADPWNKGQRWKPAIRRRKDI